MSASFCELRFMGDPADEAFFAALGRFIAAWSRLENGLAAHAEIIRYCTVWGKTSDEPLPRALKRTLDYMLRFARATNNPQLEKWTQFRHEINKLAAFRHDIAHGLITEMEPGTGRAVFFRIEGGEPTRDARTVEVFTETLRAATSASLAWGDFVWNEPHDFHARRKPQSKKLPSERNP